jgi:hypothetical protein
MLIESKWKLAKDSPFMTRSIWRCARASLAVLGLCTTVLLLGCGGSNENERENALTAAPGKPPENPNESFADRRARTRGSSKQMEKIEARNKATAEKKAKGAN